MQAKSRLYGRRVKGDLDLGLEPARITPVLDRDWARDYHPGGRIPGGVFQEIHEVSKDRNYRIATRLAMDDRVFRYAKIGTLVKPLEYGIGMATMVVSTTLTAPNVVAGAINTYTVEVILAGVNENDYEFGYLSIRDMSGPYLFGGRILSNTASDVANHVIFTLERPLPFAVDPAADPITVTPSAYANVIRTTGFATCHHTYVGVSFAYGIDVLAGALNGYYIWIQTWGPFAEINIGGSHEGAGQFERSLYFAGDGSVQLPACASGEIVGGPEMAWCGQHAGYYLPESSAGVLDHPLVFLTISP